MHRSYTHYSLVITGRMKNNSEFISNTPFAGERGDRRAGRQAGWYMHTGMQRQEHPLNAPPAHHLQTYTHKHRYTHDSSVMMDRTENSSGSFSALTSSTPPAGDKGDRQQAEAGW